MPPTLIRFTNRKLKLQLWMERKKSSDELYYLVFQVGELKEVGMVVVVVIAVFSVTDGGNSPGIGIRIDVVVVGVRVRIFHPQARHS